MAKVILRPGTPEHIALLCKTARQADIDEVYAASGQTMNKALTYALNISDWCIAAFSGDELICMAGLAPVNHLCGVYAPWLLGSNAVYDNSLSFQRAVRKFFPAFTLHAQELVNYVDDRNADSKRWLERLGFELHEPEPYGYLGLPFRKFTMRVEDNV